MNGLAVLGLAQVVAEKAGVHIVQMELAGGQWHATCRTERYDDRGRHLGHSDTRVTVPNLLRDPHRALGIPTTDSLPAHSPGHASPQCALPPSRQRALSTSMAGQSSRYAPTGDGAASPPSGAG